MPILHYRVTIKLLSNNTEILTFVQLGAETGLHFRGSVQGIWPIGLDGVSMFDTLAPSPLSNPEGAAGMNAYDYTLNQQGLRSSITCSNTETNPFSFASAGPLSSDVALAIAYNASFANQGEMDTLNVPKLFSTWGNSTLVYWACKHIGQ